MDNVTDIEIEILQKFVNDICQNTHNFENSAIVLFLILVLYICVTVFKILNQNVRRT
jgi:hypothetical protein